MLHELCHIRHHPHNDAFHALWNEVRHEFNVLVLNGHTDTLKHELQAGSNPYADLCMIGERHERTAIEQMKRRAARTEAVEETADEEAFMQEALALIRAQEEHEYGGSSMAACEEAAEEEAFMQDAMALIRVQDEQYGGSSAAASEKTSEDEAFMQKAMALIRVEEEQEYGGSSARAGGQNPYCQQGTLAMESTHDSWDCEICTLRNPPNCVSCEACGIDRPNG